MLFARLMCVLLALSALSACGTKPVYDDAAKIARVSYVHDAPPSLTLITMINNKTGSGGHSSLMINSDQRTMYDPAGRYKSAAVAEYGDLVYGISPEVLQNYVSFHARETHHVVLQTVEVSPEVARQAYRAAQDRGTSWDAMCATNVTTILKNVDGFEQLAGSPFPAALMKKFGELPGVKTEEVYENDKGQRVAREAVVR